MAGGPGIARLSNGGSRSGCNSSMPFGVQPFTALEKRRCMALPNGRAPSEEGVVGDSTTAFLIWPSKDGNHSNGKSSNHGL